MDTTLEKIQIDTESLRELLKKELYNALDFSWTGWRIPIYVEEDGTLGSGGWLSQGSWQPDALEVYSLETWNMGDRGYLGEYTEKENLEEGEEGYNDADIEYEIEESLDWIMDVFEGVASERVQRDIELI